MGDSSLTLGNTFIVCRCQSADTDCPGRWWSLPLWRYSKTSWGSGQPAVGVPAWGIRQDGHQKSPSTSTTLWFCAYGCGSTEICFPTWKSLLSDWCVLEACLHVSVKTLPVFTIVNHFQLQAQHPKNRFPYIICSTEHNQSTNKKEGAEKSRLSKDKDLIVLFHDVFCVLLCIWYQEKNKQGMTGGKLRVLASGGWSSAALAVQQEELLQQVVSYHLSYREHDTLLFLPFCRIWPWCKQMFLK